MIHGGSEEKNKKGDRGSQRMRHRDKGIRRRGGGEEAEEVFAKEESRAHAGRDRYREAEHMKKRNDRGKVRRRNKQKSQ